MVKRLPKKYKDTLSAYGVQVIDSGCGEVVGWDYRFIKWLDREDFDQLRKGQYGSIFYDNSVGV